MVDQRPRLNVDASHEGGNVVLEVPVEAVEVGERSDAGAFDGAVADEATHFADVGGVGDSVGGEGGAVVVPVCLERGGGRESGKGRGGVEEFLVSEEEEEEEAERREEEQASEATAKELTVSASSSS